MTGCGAEPHTGGPPPPSGTETRSLGERGFGLVEAAIALSLLSVGLIGAAGWVRAVARETDQARVLGDAALVAQEALEAALAGSFGSFPPDRDSRSIGGRTYAVEHRLEATDPDLERIEIQVTALAAPGFGPEARGYESFTTWRRRSLPRLWPPVASGP